MGKYDYHFLKAFWKAAGRMEDCNIIATEQHAGTVTLDNGRKVQVFVKLYEFDKDLLDREPMTGGLVVNAG